MAKKRGFNKIILSLMAFVVGVVGCFSALIWLTAPETDELSVFDDTYYSKSEIKHGNFASTDADISIHFLELGNKYTGDCTFIQTPTCDILIDCGSKSNSLDTIEEYLRHYVTDGKLEYVIVTHAHQDHYAGFATSGSIQSMFQRFECETVIDFAQSNNQASKSYQNYQKNLIGSGATHFTALDCVTDESKNNFEIGQGITLKILETKYYTEKAKSENNYSVCCLISQEVTDGETKNFLFTGDLEGDGEQSLLAKNNLSKVELYKAGHHGSGTSSTSDFIDVIQPKTVCVCCCAGSSEYTTNKLSQFPTQAFVDSVGRYTTEIYVTTLCVDYASNEFTSFNGDIVYASKEKQYNVICSNNNIVLKDSDWFKENRVWNGI